MKLFKIKHSANYWYKHYCKLWKIKRELESNGYFLGVNSDIDKAMWFTMSKYCNMLRGNDGKS